MFKMANDEIEQAFREGYAQGKKDAKKIARWVKSDDEYYCNNVVLSALRRRNEKG